MSARQLCRETTRRPKALFLFPQEMKTGIAPTRVIVEKNVALREGSKVTVNWAGKKTPAEILALDDDEEVLSKKDIEWSSKNLPVAGPTPSTMEEPDLPAAEVHQPNKPPRKTKDKSRLPKERTEHGEASPEVADDPYTAFLDEQRKREVDWASNRAAKRAKAAETSTKDLEAEVMAIKRELEAKRTECAALKSQLHDQRVNDSAMEQNEKIQENFCKMMEKLEDSLSAMEDNMSRRLGRIEQRLDSFEQMFNGPRLSLDPLPVVPEEDDLPTIDSEALASLSDCFEDFVPLPLTPVALVTPEVTGLSVQSLSAQHSASESTGVAVGDDVIRSCVTPRKIRGVQELLQKENERHKCALKLLPIFFSKEELSNSNTEGTHKKLPLDSTRLNSLKVLVFSRFPVDSPVEREKVWRTIKGKINSKCRLSKHIYKHAIGREV